MLGMLVAHLHCTIVVSNVSQIPVEKHVHGKASAESGWSLLL